MITNFLALPSSTCCSSVVNSVQSRRAEPFVWSCSCPTHRASYDRQLRALIVSVLCNLLTNQRHNNYWLMLRSAGKSKSILIRKSVKCNLIWIKMHEPSLSLPVLSRFFYLIFVFRFSAFSVKDCRKWKRYLWYFGHWNLSFSDNHNVWRSN